MSDNSRRFSAVLFDLGGTLVKTSSVPEILERILTEHRVHRPLSDIEAAQKDTDSRLTLADYALSSDNFWEKWNLQILRKLGVKKNLRYLTRVIGEKWWQFAKVELYPEVIEILDYLKSHGFKTGLVTNGFKSDIDEILPKVRLEGYFHVVVGVDAVGVPKPHKEIFLLALKKLNVHSQETIFVGDSLKLDYEGAEAAGLTALLIDREDEVKSNVRKIRRLTELKTYLE